MTIKYVIMVIISGPKIIYKKTIIFIAFCAAKAQSSLYIPNFVEQIYSKIVKLVSLNFSLRQDIFFNLSSNGEKLQPGKYATGIMFMEEDKEKVS